MIELTFMGKEIRHTEQGMGGGTCVGAYIDRGILMLVYEVDGLLGVLRFDECTLVS